MKVRGSAPLAGTHPRGERALPHQRIHRRGREERPREVPRAHDAREEVVAEPVRSLCKRVGRERGEQEHVGPLAELDVEDWVLALVPAAPLVLIREDLNAPKRRRVRNVAARGH